MSENFIVIVGLGANQGNPVEQIKKATSHLQAFANKPVKLSPFWRSEAYGMNDGSSDFVNAVAVFETNLEPMTLLTKMQAIEVELGRPAAHAKNVARTIDLDLLIYGDVTMNSERLTLPHPRIAERLFVLLPLRDLLPDYRHGSEGIEIEELVRQAPAIEISRL